MLRAAAPDHTRRSERRARLEDGMVKAGSPAVDAYIAKQPPRVRALLRRVRSVVRKALPGAEETLSYQIPSYRLHRTYVIYFAGWKEHYSLYPVTDRVVARMEGELRLYRVSKGTARFPLDQPVPEKLIARIAKALGQDAAERAAAKTEARKAGERRRASTLRG
jgi:uncharacterized protein YdhG (YjbR/CyaY superfamily)